MSEEKSLEEEHVGTCLMCTKHDTCIIVYAIQHFPVNLNSKMTDMKLGCTVQYTPDPPEVTP